MSIAILILMSFLMVLYTYLSTFALGGFLPYRDGFAFFDVILFRPLLLVNFIYMFGPLVGFILFLLTFFSIIQICFLWPFTYILYLLFPKAPFSDIQMSIYLLFPLGIWILFILTIINFFISKYMSIYMALKEYLSVGTLTSIGIIGIISAIIGLIVFEKMKKHL